MKTLKIAFFFLLIFSILPNLKASENQKNNSMDNHSDSLVVVWTSGDKDVAMKMVFMYTYNAKKNTWWDDITLVIWGPSSKLLSEDEDLQNYVKMMQEQGVKVEACIACAESYGVTGKLKSLGIEVKGMGVPLTDYLKSGRKVITF